MPHAQAKTSTVDNVELYVNDGLLTPTSVAKLQASYPTEASDVLYKRYLANGYILVKGLLPRQDVLAAREAYFKSMAPSGVLKPGTEPVEGVFDDAADPEDYPGIGAGSGKNSRPGETSTADVFVDLALKAHTEPWYVGSEDGSVQGFCNHPVLKDFVAKLTGWGDATLPVRRTLLRNNTPGNKAIGVHYDQSFMRYGEPTAVTAWVPMGDIKLDGGGLIYLEDSEALGAEIENDFAKKAKAAGMSDEEMRNAFNSNMMSTGFLAEGPKDFGLQHGRRWLVKNRIRLGTDLRFVNSARPWDTRWNKDFEFGDGV
ncbi:phytanoyl hydroxylase [Fusarium beomiforme]|uniref:Phytanoyl hydroxylase n=1 Tax=Fusarium beomiforme TaxID=44412 RepID=A0A9P5AN42_9HYPO|nr:phytanoyl hydroxylase [Fusarium beomiforme]